jgi:GntR family transcriptional regulator
MVGIPGGQRASTVTVSERVASSRPRRKAQGLNIALNRDGGLPLVDQLVSQLELQILSGALAEGHKLPSVRALARRLDVDPRTVHAAYRKLVLAGNLALARGSGAFVIRGTTHVDEGRPLPDLGKTLRHALRSALQAGHSPDAIRAAVREWVEREPPARLVVVDAARETAEILVEELRVLGFASSACELNELPASLGTDTVALALPFHHDGLRRTFGDAVVIMARLATSAPHADVIERVPPGGLILVVSHSPRVVTYARSLLQILRGHDVVIECHTLEARALWMRTAGLADLVLADVLAFPAVGAVSSKVRELRLLTPETLEEVRAVMSLPVPSLPRALRVAGQRP